MNTNIYRKSVENWIDKAGLSDTDASELRAIVAGEIAHEIEQAREDDEMRDRERKWRQEEIEAKACLDNAIALAGDFPDEDNEWRIDAAAAALIEIQDRTARERDPEQAAELARERYDAGERN